MTLQNLTLQNRILASVALLVALVAVSGCAKKKPLPPPATAPVAAATAPAPTAQITATPTLVSAGDQVQLSWRTTDATSVSIDGIGDVPTTGVKTVTPSVSTSFHLVARGEGGTADATARVPVIAPPAVVVPTSYHMVARGEGGSADATARVTVNAPPAVQVPVSTMSAEEEFKANVQDIFYDYDTAEIRTDAQATLSRDAQYLVSHPEVKVVLGGYCDERGSNEYNIGLGQNRGDAAKNALVTAGVAANRIRVVSYGKEKPFCSESTEECWQQNRRAGFTLDR